MAVKPVAAAITNLQLGAPQTEFAETISVTMLRNIYDPSGTLLQAKTTQSVSGAFAQWLVENQYATTTSSSLPMESNLRIGPEQAVIQALVSEAGFLGGNVTAKAANILALRKLIGRALAGERVRVLLVGDSTTVGAGANTGSNGLVGGRAKNYPSVLARMLTAAGVTAVNDAVIGSQLVESGSVTYMQYDPRATISAGFVATATAGLMGSRAWVSTASGSTFALAVASVFDKIDVYYNTTPGGGNLVVNVDGGATLATISTNAAVGFAKTTVTCASGTHTINIATDSTASTTLTGIVPYSSLSGGIDILQAAVFGGNMGTPANNANAWSYSNATNLSLYAPALVILQMTINDANSVADPVVYSTRLDTFYAACIAQGAEFMLMSGIPSNPASYPTSNIDTLRAIVEAKALANTKIFADLFERLGSYANSTANGWMADAVHGNAKLYADEARWLTALLLTTGP